MLGRSSLVRAEAHVRAGIAAVSAALGAIFGDDASLASAARIGRLCAAQDRLLAESATGLLGPEPANRRTRVMVTLPSEAAQDAALIGDLVGRGMDIARINGAHDGPNTWHAMAALVRSAARDAGRDCRILFDLPGPKLRIGPLPATPGQLRLKTPSEPDDPKTFLLDGSGAPGTPGAMGSHRGSRSTQPGSRTCEPATGSSVTTPAAGRVRSPQRRASRPRC